MAEVTHYLNFAPVEAVQFDAEYVNIERIYAIYASRGAYYFGSSSWVNDKRDLAQVAAGWFVEVHETVYSKTRLLGRITPPTPIKPWHLATTMTWHPAQWLVKHPDGRVTVQDQEPPRVERWKWGNRYSTHDIARPSEESARGCLVSPEDRVIRRPVLNNDGWTGPWEEVTP